MSTVITVLSGGLRVPSSTRLLADHIGEALKTEAVRDGVPPTIHVVELRTLARNITDAMLTGYPSEELDAAFTTLADSDGLVAVTPAFNASFSGLFKSFFDVLPEETLAGMPVLIAATGGTERHSLVLEHALRPMFSYLHALVSPTGIYAATADFGGQSASASLDQRITRAASDFTRLLHSCGPRERRDAWGDELATMEGLLNPSATKASTPAASSLDDVGPTS